MAFEAGKQAIEIAEIQSSEISAIFVGSESHPYAVKPTSSIPQEQPTVDSGGKATTIATKGRHDPCLLPRFIPMAEAMVAITLADHALRHRATAAL